ncbi:MAG: acyltransferase [Chitinophagales bacterium]
MQKKIYFENLDGLRFLCFFSVFLFHSFYTEVPEVLHSPMYRFVKNDVFGNGNLGVNFFFVLSGFLITYLLIEEKKLNGQINVPFFWLRRILRIWPLFYFCVAFGFFGFPLLKHFFGQTPHETATLPYFLTFLNNFEFISKGPPDASTLGVLWSVAVEEQFYLVWPVVLYFLPVRQFWIAFVSVIGASLLFRFLNPDPILYEHHTLSCIGDMAIGALGAWLMLEFPPFHQWVNRWPKWAITLLYVCFLVVFLFRDEMQEAMPAIQVVERALIAVMMLFIILEQTFAQHSWFKMSQFKVISYLGKITYGLYCLHFIGILIAITISRLLHLNDHVWEVLVLDTAMALMITLGISFISYSYFEKPFLKLKDRFAFILK